jgi:hypothetical protein
MIIRFSKDITLSEWCEVNDPSVHLTWCRKLVPDINSNYPYILVGIFPHNSTNSVIFYGKLYFMRQHFPSKLFNDLMSAKKYADNFLIKMSGLTAFL